MTKFTGNPTVFEGVQYPSRQDAIRAAAQFANLDPSMIVNRCNAHNETVEKAVYSILLSGNKTKLCRKVKTSFNGKQYPTIQKACKAAGEKLGIKWTTIKNIYYRESMTIDEIYRELRQC